MKTKVPRQIRLDELQAVLDKMNFYSMKEGYIGFIKDKLELFVSSCEKANAFITKEQVEEAIAEYETARDVC